MKFYGEGAYDRWKIYTTLEIAAIKPVIPLQKNAVIKRYENSSQPRLSRDEAIRVIQRTSRKAWKVDGGYNRRSLVETTMYRWKTIFGGKIKNENCVNNEARRDYIAPSLTVSTCSEGLSLCRIKRQGPESVKI